MLDLEMDLDAKMSAADVAASVKVTKQTFNHWRRTGKVTPVAYDRNGRALYRRHDVMLVERAMRNSPRSSRGSQRRRIDGRYRAGDVLAVEAEMRQRSGREVRRAA